VSSPVPVQCESQAQLERHVEPYRHSDSAEVVDRDPRLFEDLEDPRWPSLPSIRELESATWFPAKRQQGSDEPDENTLVSFVVGNIEEYGFVVRLATAAARLIPRPRAQSPRRSISALAEASSVCVKPRLRAISVAVAGGVTCRCDFVPVFNT
jgi:hypothetical protein